MTQDERAARLLKLREDLGKLVEDNGYPRPSAIVETLSHLVVELCDAMLDSLDGSDKDERRNEDCVRLSLSRDDAARVADALDSHVYWKLSDERYRSGGSVMPPGSDDDDKADEIRQTMWLADRVRGVFPKDGG